jgi:hypothetical protein
MQDKHMVILVLYVDDLIIIGNNEADIKQVKEELKEGFKMTNLGTLHYYLGVKYLNILTKYSLVKLSMPLNC